MKVIALTRTSSIGPSTRYRIEQYRPLLSRRDIQVQTHALFGPTWFRILEMRAGPVRTFLKALYSAGRLVARVVQCLGARLAAPDVLHVEQQLFPYLPAVVELLLWPRHIPTILEFDDAIFLTSGHRRKLERLCARASVVVVGNRFLAEFAQPHARRLLVIPTTVDLDRYGDARKVQEQRRTEPDDVFRIGWIGLRYNFPFLRELAEPLGQLIRAGTDVELRIISSGAPETGGAWNGVRVVHRPWSSETEATEIAACDVGVMPLPDTDWARGKCALKILQYMAAGVPVVCSPVGVNREIVRDGDNGLLASRPEDWERALGSLVSDRDLRQRLASAGLRTVRDRFSIGGGAEKVAEAYGLASLRAEGDGE